MSSRSKSNRGWQHQPIRHGLASQGIKSSFNQEKMIEKDDVTEIIDRGHSYRNFRPDDFLQHSLNEKGEVVQEKYIEARSAYNKMEGGRFNKMMDSVLKFFNALDEDEKEVWVENNPELVNWLGIHGFLQILDTCEEFTGIPSYYEFEKEEEV